MKTEYQIKNAIEVLKEIDYYEAEKWIKVLVWVLDSPKNEIKK